MPITPFATSTASTATANLTILKPAGTAAGDFLIAVLGYYTQAAPVIGPEGWIKLDEGQHSSQTYNMASVWYRVCNGLEGSSFTWHFGGGTLDEQHGAILGLNGVDNTIPIQTWSEKLDGTSDQITASGVTVTTAPTMLLLLGGCNAASFNNTQTTTPPSGFAEMVELHGSAYGGVYGAYGYQSTTGPSGSVAATNSAAVAMVTYLVALNESTGGTPKNLYVSATGGVSTASVAMTVDRAMVTAAVMATNTANARLLTGATGDNPITFTTPQTATRTSNGTTLTINAPTNIANDVIYIAWVSDGDSDTATPPTGFTAVTGYNGVAVNSPTLQTGTFCLWSKTSAGSEPSTYTINSTVSERSAAVAFAARNQLSVHSTGTTQSGTSGSSTTGTVPAVTTTVTGCMRISIIASNADLTAVTTLSGHTQLATANVASGGTVNVQYKALPTATTDASQNATFTAGGSWIGLSFTIAPTVTVSGYQVNLVANASGVTATNSSAAAKIARPLVFNRAGATATGTSTLYITHKLLAAIGGLASSAGAAVNVARSLLTGQTMATATPDAVLATARGFAAQMDGATATPDAALDNTRGLTASQAAATETPDAALGMIWSLLFSRASITGTADPSLAVTRALVGAASVLASTPDPTLHLSLGLTLAAAAATGTGDTEMRVGHSLTAAGAASSATSAPNLSIAGLVTLLLAAAAASNTAPAGLSVIRSLAAATAGATVTGSPALSTAKLVSLLLAAAAESLTPGPGLAVTRTLALSAPAGSGAAIGTLTVLRPLVAVHVGATEASTAAVTIARSLALSVAALTATPVVDLDTARLINLLAAIAAQAGASPAPALDVARTLALSATTGVQTGIGAFNVLRPLVAARPDGTGATTAASTAGLDLLRSLVAGPTASSATSEAQLVMYLIVGLLRITIAAKRPSVTAWAKN